MKIKSILIANRSEIAIRIAKTAKRMGIKTYMFLTHQEPNALNVESADEVIDMTEDTSVNIFMDIDRIIETAKIYKIDAIHPGYGFLSENPELARKCEENGINYIGPSHVMIEQMGDKGVARRIAIECGVSVLRGSTGVVESMEDAHRVAQDIGFPVIIKAVAGGGGKGMRVARTDDELEKMFYQASKEAMSVFGNGDVFIEKYVDRPKHIEMQVIADKHGNVRHLFERECSIQRKHQKLLEEAPSSVLTDDLREKISQEAIKLCKSTGYYSAGTVEFLVDSDMNHYFMEMNTRIQVEHPITEAISGVDLVEQQIRIAEGEKLSFSQEDIKLNGHAIEFRINAEDVQSGFSPDTGIIEHMEFPQGEGIRVDSGYCTGKIIPACFDSLVAKLIIHAPTRAEAIRLAWDALEKVKIRGVKTTLPFFKQVLKNQSFINGSYTTSFIEEELQQIYYQEENELQAAAALALKAYFKERDQIENSEMRAKQMSIWVQSRVFNGN